MPPGPTTMSAHKNKIKRGESHRGSERNNYNKAKCVFFFILKICVDTNLQELNILHKQEKRY